ncbi:exodeoxyribonuclease VII small subunit [Fusibacter sp. JL216-2]|uniref:exodeoxyribonuclease VII small subunit n=1 Tax=Fusibacter sp. JL216-2 TaxID=3071453 RepID=UPI003D34DC5E
MPKKKNFENQLDRLKEIVDMMEQGSVKLEDALKLFEEGVGIYSNCNKLLEDAEQKIKIMTSVGEEDFENS